MKVLPDVRECCPIGVGHRSGVGFNRTGIGCVAGEARQPARVRHHIARLAGVDRRTSRQRSQGQGGAAVIAERAEIGRAANDVAPAIDKPADQAGGIRVSLFGLSATRQFSSRVCPGTGSERSLAPIATRCLRRARREENVMDFIPTIAGGPG